MQSWCTDAVRGFERTESPGAEENIKLGLPVSLWMLGALSGPDRGIVFVLQDKTNNNKELSHLFQMRPLYQLRLKCLTL